MRQVPPQAVPAQAVQVVSNTWAREKHNLFDFESCQLHRQTFTVQNSMMCVRKDTNVDMLSERTSLPLESDPLFQIEQKDGAFWVDNAALPRSSSETPWLVVRDMPTGGHRLSENDVIKLGRLKFRVRQLVASVHGGTQPDLRLPDSGSSCCPNSSQDELRSTMCRICLQEGPCEDDPLISPCACKGSVEYIHLGCLRHWIHDRLGLSDASDGSFFYRPLPCELCTAIYPTYVMVEVSRTEPPYIILENKNFSHGFYVVSLAEKVAKLGRSKESHVCINDISISRCHAMIRFDDGQFILEDNNSKFGTAVAMKKPWLLESGTMSVQVGRTVLSLFVQPDPFAASCQPMPPRTGSNEQEERALRLSLLDHGSSRAALAEVVSGAGAFEEPAHEAAARVVP